MTAMISIAPVTSRHVTAHWPERELNCSMTTAHKKPPVTFCRFSLLGVYSDTHLLALMYAGEMCYWHWKVSQNACTDNSSLQNRIKTSFDSLANGTKFLQKFVNVVRTQVRGNGWDFSQAEKILAEFASQSWFYSFLYPCCMEISENIWGNGKGFVAVDEAFSPAPLGCRKCAYTQWKTCHSLKVVFILFHRGKAGHGAAGHVYITCFFSVRNICHHVYL